MKAVFADTLYWVAIVKPGDSWRKAAERAHRVLGPVKLITSDEVLTEFLAAMSRGGAEFRRKAVQTVRKIMANPNVRVVAQSRDTFLHALERYDEREDKSYSLTDCSCMNAMDAAGIREILTNDHHFRQEGYVVLINE